MKKMFKNLLVAIICCFTVLSFTACDSQDKDKDYRLNKSSIEYVIGTDFADLGLYLVNTNDDADKVAVTKEMFKDSSIFNSPRKDEDAIVIYKDIEYDIVVSVKRDLDSQELQSAISEFLTKYENAQDTNSKLTLSTDLKTNYLGETDTLKNSGAEEIASTGAIGDTLLEIIKQSLLNVGTSDSLMGYITPEYLSGKIAPADLVEFLYNNSELLNGFSKSVAKRILNRFYFVENDAYYINDITDDLAETFMLNTTGENEVYDLVFTYFNKVRTLEIQVSEVVTALTELDSIVATYSQLETADKADYREMLANLKTAVSNLNEGDPHVVSCLLEMAKSSMSEVYKITRADETHSSSGSGSCGYLNPGRVYLTDTSEIDYKDRDYVEAFIAGIESIEDIIAGEDLATSLASLSENLDTMYQSAMFFFESDTYGMSSLLLGYHEYYEYLGENDLYMSVVKDDPTFLSYGAIATNMASGVVSEYGQLTPENIIKYFATMFIEDYKAVAVDYIMEYLCIDTTQGTERAEVEALVDDLANALTTLNEDGSFDPLTFAQEFCAIFYNHYTLLENYIGFSETQAKAVKGLLKAVADQESIATYVTNNKTALVSAFSDLINGFLYVEQGENTTAVTVFFTEQFGKIETGEFVVTDFVLGLDTLVNQVGDPEAVQVIAPYLDYVTGFINVYNGDMTYREYIAEAGFIELAVGLINQKYFEIYGEEMSQDTLEELCDILSSVADLDFMGLLDTYKLELSEELAWMACDMLCSDIDEVENYQTFFYGQIQKILNNQFDVVNAVSEFVNLVESTCDFEVQSGVKSILIAQVVVLDKMYNLDVDYNELIGDVDIPGVEVDFNVLVNKMTSPEELAKMLTIKDVQISYVMNNAGEVVSQVMTYTVALDFDMMFMSVKGDIVLSLEVGL